MQSGCPLRIIRTIAVLLVVLPTFGCGRGEALIPAGGTVVNDGTPLTDGLVVFMPAESGRPAQGELASDGSFYLATDGVPGVRPGRYQAMIRPNAAPTEGSSTATQLPIPPRFTSHTSSGLEYEIVTEGQNRFTIEIPKE